MSLSRRKFLGWIGAAGMTAAAGRKASAATTHHFEGYPDSMAVLHDITNLRRLESMRTEFVANVSHEIKTPITSIKGFIETLLDGAMEDPENRERFLKIVARQADRPLDEVLALRAPAVEDDDVGIGAAGQGSSFRESEACGWIAAQLVDRLFQGYQLSQELQDEGIEVFGMGQGFISMAVPVKEFEKRLLGRKPKRQPNGS